MNPIQFGNTYNVVFIRDTQQQSEQQTGFPDTKALMDVFSKTLREESIGIANATHEVETPTDEGTSKKCYLFTNSPKKPSLRHFNALVQQAGTAIDANRLLKTFKKDNDTVEKKAERLANLNHRIQEEGLVTGDEEQLIVHYAKIGEDYLITNPNTVAERIEKLEAGDQ